VPIFGVGTSPGYPSAMELPSIEEKLLEAG